MLLNLTFFFQNPNTHCSIAYKQGHYFRDTQATVFRDADSFQVIKITVKE